MDRSLGCSPQLMLASTFFDRMMGLFSKRQRGGVLMLVPCRSIHTLGMSGPIDVAFFDASGLVLRAYVGLPPCRFLRCRRAVGVLERTSSNREWFVEGDILSLGKTR